MSATAVIGGLQLAHSIGSNLIGARRARDARRRRREQMNNLYNEFKTEISPELQAQTELTGYADEMQFDSEFTNSQYADASTNLNNQFNTMASRGGFSGSGFTQNNMERSMNSLNMNRDNNLKSIYDKYYTQMDGAQATIDQIEQRNQELRFKTLV